MPVHRSLSFVARWQHLGLCLAISLFLASFFLISFSGLNFGGNATGVTATTTPARVGLAKLRWCGTPLLVFRDEGAPPPVTPTVGTPTATVTATAAGTASTTATASA